MKTYLTYGFAWAIAGALVNLVFYFAGFHSEAGKYQTSQWLGFILALAIAITCLVLGTKARRASVPTTEEFGYGRAFAAGFMITLFATLFAVAANALYFGVVNPDLTEIIVETEMAKLEARNLPPEALEGAEKGVRFMTQPVMMAIVGFFFGLIGGTILSLITSAFLRRPANASAQPPVAA